MIIILLQYNNNNSNNDNSNNNNNNNNKNNYHCYWYYIIVIVTIIVIIVIVIIIIVIIITCMMTHVIITCITCITCLPWMMMHLIAEGSVFDIVAGGWQPWPVLLAYVPLKKWGGAEFLMIHDIDTVMLQTALAWQDFQQHITMKHLSLQSLMYNMQLRPWVWGGWWTCLPAPPGWS